MGAVFSSFRLEYPGAGGESLCISGLAPGSEIELVIEKTINLPMVAYPEGKGMLLPAGGIWPWGDDSGDLVCLSWEEGFAAELFLDLWRLQISIDRINYPRLKRELWERSGGDPFLVNREPVLEALALGVMRADKIKQLPRRDLSVPAAPGLWCSPDPLSPFRYVYSAEGEAVFPLLRGFTSYYHAETGQRIDFYENGAGWRAANPFTGYAESGTW